VHPLAKELKNIDMIEDLPLTFYNWRVFGNLLPKVAGIAVMPPGCVTFLIFSANLFQAISIVDNCDASWLCDISNLFYYLVTGCFNLGRTCCVTGRSWLWRIPAVWHFLIFYHYVAGCFNRGRTCCVTGKSWHCCLSQLSTTMLQAVSTLDEPAA